MDKENWRAGGLQVLIGTDQILDFLLTQAVKRFEHHLTFRLAS